MPPRWTRRSASSTSPTGRSGREGGERHARPPAARRRAVPLPAPQTETRAEPVKGLIGLLILVLGVAGLGLLAEACAFGGAWLLHGHGLFDDEIQWLATCKPWMPWEPGIGRLIAQR